MYPIKKKDVLVVEGILFWIKEINWREREHMTFIIAGRSNKGAFIMADTMMSVIDSNGMTVEKYNERKIYWCHENFTVLAGMNLLDISKNIFNRIENTKINSTNQYRDIYYEELEKFKKENPDWDEKGYLNRQFIIYRSSDGIQLIILLENEEHDICKVTNGIFYSLPGDINESDYIESVDINYAWSLGNLKPYMQKFIDISEQSEYVGEICCLVIVNQWGKLDYYEGNMYELFDNIRTGIVKSDITTLVRNRPRFIEAGIQKDVPEK